MTKSSVIVTSLTYYFLGIKSHARCEGNALHHVRRLGTVCRLAIAPNLHFAHSHGSTK